MQIKKVEIRNFRNIKSATYDLTKRVAFSGKNFTGKTNSLLAIYWLLTDYLLDGSQDIPTIKPLDDPKLEAVVKITLDDGCTIEKRYSENWVKTRGTDIVTLQGHNTVYYINDAKQPTISAATAFIKEKLGLDKYSPKTKIDTLRMLLNPLYLPEQVEWKSLRNYIIELVGDISDADVIATNIFFNKIVEDLRKNNGRTDLVMKNYNQQISTCKSEIEKLNVGIEDLLKTQDVNPNELEIARTQIRSIEDQIAELQVARTTLKNPRIAELEAIINAVAEEKNASVEADRLAYEETNKITYESINNAQTKLRNLYAEVAKDNEMRAKVQSEINSLKVKLQNNIDLTNMKNSRIAELRKKYSTVAVKEFVAWPLPQLETCPHCGGALNQEFYDREKVKLEQAKIEFDKQIDAELDSINQEGQRLKLEVEELEFKGVELNTELVAKQSQLPPASIVEEKNKLISQINSEIADLQSKIIPFAPSDKTNNLTQKLVDLRNELAMEKSKNFTSDIDSKIFNLRGLKDQFAAIERKHLIYLDTQKMIADKQVQIANYQKLQNEYEAKQQLVEEFIRTKLSMLNENVSKVFGKIKFTLIENNIKEGSYNEVCYPLIVGKETAFHNGSTSEKVITGVAIIEALRTYLGLPELPILFDEAESLDSETLVSRLNTNCQIISTKVDDNYSTPTVVSL